MNEKMIKSVFYYDIKQTVFLSVEQCVLEMIDVSTFTSLWMETSVASRFASNISGINSIGIFDKGKKR